MQLTYAKNIKSKNTVIKEGIIDIDTMKLYCICTEEVAKEILAEKEKLKEATNILRDVRDKNDCNFLDYELEFIKELEILTEN